MENNNELMQFLILRNESLAEELGFARAMLKTANMLATTLKEQLIDSEDDDKDEDEDDDDGDEYESFSDWLNRINDFFKGSKGD